ncbi:undecaprenyl-phosphate glucose phosphotransferase [Photobacterium atrarenae]|uniref:Undecaprenyl-phosphate glucose phosphotransferase n=1 Tax=Photobacterium atrarenae TaxID=865757 RepID=A0ABY5GNE4_9GAMM|nr:undecaprenyl-phosphate glucose phosphotransferase [Photobacterium atrarenae]UTV30453.1 undecaprenyl-phosphate glucose phosphotransferase [Photobacterium atrarenae]
MKNRDIIREKEPDFGLLYRLVDISIVALTLYISLGLYLQEVASNYYISCAFGMICFLLSAESCHLYRSWRTGTFREHAIATLLSWILTVFILIATAYFTKKSTDFSRVVIGLWFVLTPFALIIWRFAILQVTRQLYHRGYYTQKAAIIGVTENGIALAEELKLRTDSGIILEGFYDERDNDRIPKDLKVPICGSVSDALEKARQGELKHIYIAMPLYAKGRITQFLEKFSDTTANTYLIPDFFSYNLLYSRLGHVGGIQVLSVFDTPFNGLTAWVKRIEDIILASIILVLSSPLLIAIVIGVKLSSPGPVLFKQDRYGLDGKKIKVWKFRTMSTTDNGALIKQATRNDFRVTAFGAFLRRTSLDEFPQFINVLQGTMSIVGPRPHAVAHNEEYRAIVERYMLRHKVKPGITGWAQINGYRGETDTISKMEKRVEYDLAYIQCWSLSMDLKIICLTTVKIFSDKMAY